jgi:hypothetical protein
MAYDVNGMETEIGSPGIIYHFLDILFIVFHSFFILFNLFGWIFRKIRRLNLITLLLTGFSWFILGIWYGLGYCPFTDWHWQVRIKLGSYDLPQSYVKFLINQLTGINLPDRLVDTITATGFFAALLISGYLNFRDIKKNRNREEEELISG